MILEVNFQNCCMSQKILCKCDYCGKKFPRTKHSIIRSHLITESDSCGSKRCKTKKREESNLKVYGEKYPTRNNTLPYADVYLTDVQKSIICGSLLGDASITRGALNHNCRFTKTHSMKQKNYLIHIANELKPFTSYTKEGYSSAKGKKYEKIQLSTFSHPIFTELYKIWYNSKGTKIVPKDIRLDPLSVAVWFCDDGSQDESRNFTFHTNAFSKKECQILVNQLSSFGISSYIYLKSNKYYVIKVRSESYDCFIDLISPFVHDYIKYKIKRKIKKIFDPSLCDGGLGTFFEETKKEWRSSICINYKTIHLGRYSTQDQAIAIRKLAVEIRASGETNPEKFKELRRTFQKSLRQ